MKKILESKYLDLSNYDSIARELDMSRINLFQHNVFSLFSTSLDKDFSLEKFIMQCNKKLLFYPDGKFDEFYLEIIEAWLLSQNKKGKVSILNRNSSKILEYFLTESICREINLKMKNIEEVAIWNSIEILESGDNVCNCRGVFLFYTKKNFYLLFYSAEYDDIKTLKMLKKYNIPLDQ